ncbi:mannose-1-phosphate guanylyltransferase [Salinirubrum litoreum]|uniref:Mannose-1-phosphate guanylyltransferase n=1 Tax=Salinirubrum litoreum TaxID=1126234 RepID=A0ABD5RAI4_9EURY|nr:sugar phosphate nucleotidyltransferase [Salinirubrum litoreum]
MDRTLVAVVLAGGTGTRLYPASRSDRPKQFLSLGASSDADGDGEESDSLLSRTVSRVDFADEVVVVTRPEFESGVRDHAPDTTVLTEPEGKDTGPALTYATHHVADAYDDSVVLALPSDHHVRGDFGSVARRGAEVAVETDRLVTFGVEPTRPDTGYGYLEPGEFHGDWADLDSFHEKPDRETAESYVEAGYLWNAGLFAWTPESFLAAARDSRLAPLVAELDRGAPEAGFAAVEPVSVDYAVMEEADDAAVLPATFGWDDLGSWDALDRLLAADDAGNVALGDYLSVDATENVVATDDKHVSLVGVEGLAVVAYDDRVLVVPKADAQRVREAVAELRDDGQF